MRLTDNVWFLMIMVGSVLSKTYNETLTPWTEVNCVQSTSVDFSPVNIDTQKLACDQFIFMDLVFDKSNTKTQISFYNGEDPAQFNFIPQDGLLTMYLKDKSQQIQIYKALRFIFKTPAEHTVDYIRSPLEMQIEFTLNG